MIGEPRHLWFLELDRADIACDMPEATPDLADHKVVTVTMLLDDAGGKRRTAAKGEAPLNWLASAAMQARRDRQRILRAREEIATLRVGLDALRAEIARRDAPPQNRLLGRLKGMFRRGSPATAPLSDAAAIAVPVRGRALVIDHHWPAPDRDSGSIDIVNLVHSLTKLGFDVLLAATEEAAGPSAARDKLEALGIQCLRRDPDGPLDGYLERHGEAFDLCVLCRVYCGGSFLETVQALCGRARIVFNSIDLNFLREERKAKLLQDQKLLDLLPQIRAREEHIIRESDATILVSDAEMQLIEETIPEAYCLQMPLARPILPPATPFGERRAIGFIGGFAHEPNVDAMRSFLGDIWPLVVQALPDCELSIVGAGLPPELLDGCPGRVTYLGHVPDIGPWFESLRMTIAPLRFGAGAKGKIASSLAAGVPAVVSAIAAEGMALNETSGVLVASDPQSFADCIRRLHDDPVLWGRLSDEALCYARGTLSLDGWQARLALMLQRLGF